MSEFSGRSTARENLINKDWTEADDDDAPAETAPPPASESQVPGGTAETKEAETKEAATSSVCYVFILLLFLTFRCREMILSTSSVPLPQTKESKS